MTAAELNDFVKINKVTEIFVGKVLHREEDGVILKFENGETISVFNSPDYDGGILTFKSKNELIQEFESFKENFPKLRQQILSLSKNLSEEMAAKYANGLY